MAETKIDMPRIGEVRYCKEQNAHVFIKDLILGNGVCDAVAYYIRDQKTLQVPTSQLVKNKLTIDMLNRSTWNKFNPATSHKFSPGLYPKYSKGFTRKVKLSKYEPQTTWQNIEAKMRKNIDNIVGKAADMFSSPTKKTCSCDMTSLMRDGCKCGGL